jgi:hypothetical protein
LRSESECQLLLGIPFLGIRSIAHRFVTLIERQKDMQEPVESHTNSSVSAPIPYYISETKSDMRGIKPGWYAIEDDTARSILDLFQLRGMRQENR